MAERSARSMSYQTSIAASKRMMRDFGEWKTSVTRKGTAGVSQADISAERTIQAELSKARQVQGFIMEEGPG